MWKIIHHKVHTDFSVPINIFSMQRLLVASTMNQNIIETAKSETNFIKSRAMANLPKLHHTQTRFLNVGEQTLSSPGG